MFMSLSSSENLNSLYEKLNSFPKFLGDSMIVLTSAIDPSVCGNALQNDNCSVDPQSALNWQSARVNSEYFIVPVIPEEPFALKVCRPKK
ncbi:hypothetical protein Tco_0087917 [Tanacetum coccineum]